MDSLCAVSESFLNRWRAMLSPATAALGTPRRLMIAVALWIATFAPFVVDFDAQSVAAVSVGGLLTAYVVATAWRLPLVALTVAATASIIDWHYVLALALASHLAGTRLDRSRYALLVFSVAVFVGGGAALIGGNDLYDWSIRVGFLVLFGFFPWLGGLYRRQRAALVSAGWERAAQLEEQQRIVIEQSRLRERARIANDMHDFMGHHLSLAALHAGGLELDPSLEQRHVTKVGELRASIASAGEQLREIIGVLRDESEAAPTVPAGETIEELVAHSSGAGLDITLETTGSFDGIDPMRLRAAYRLVQEGLTNVAKHAPDAAVSVRVCAEPDMLRVTVRNGPPSRSLDGEQVGGQKGITGLRERARLHGGTLSADAVDGGFALTMVLPNEPNAVVPPAETASRGVKREFRRANTRVRRSLLLALFAPVIIGAVLVLALMGLYAYDSFTSELSPHEYEAMHIGQPRSALSDIIPDRQVPERGTEPPPQPPPSSQCEFYRSTAGFLPSKFDVYRLCFRDGLLVDKNVLAR